MTLNQRCDHIATYNTEQSGSSEGKKQYKILVLLLVVRIFINSCLVCCKDESTNATMVKATKSNTAALLPTRIVK